MEALVPQNKFDSSHIEELKLLSDEEIEPILPMIKRLAINPTKWERESAADEMAQRLLQKRE